MGAGCCWLKEWDQRGSELKDQNWAHGPDEDLGTCRTETCWSKARRSRRCSKLSVQPTLANSLDCSRNCSSSLGDSLTFRRSFCSFYPSPFLCEIRSWFTSSWSQRESLMKIDKEIKDEQGRAEAFNFKSQ